MTDEPARPIRVLLVDDHAMVRRGMRDFLGLHRDLEIVGEAASGAGRSSRPRRSIPTSSSWT
jgi:DNA-binding NarL/FixJ family response regulator